MATVAHVDARFTADTSAYVRSVRDAQRATENLARSMPQADQAMGNVKTSSIALGAALGTLGAQAIVMATNKVKEFAKQGIQAAKDYEQTVISIEGIFQGMGMSVEEATSKTKSYLADLRDFAATTPFELPQTLDAVKRLLSIGYAADEVKDRLLPAIGDIVSALGQPASSISAVVYAFGQMKSAGRVMSQDLMQIGNALPGFNAKVAIAEQLFSGDMAAMAKATESGALDAETAIQAIIKAMQEFPGAAGAMARQSKTLAGVLSTFNDTVNNALIDGLMPAMPMLSEAMMELVGPVSTLATAFAGQLGPVLVEVAAKASDFAPQLTELAAAFIELTGSSLSKFIDVLGTLAPMMTAAAQAISAITGILNNLPSPILAATAALLIMMRTGIGKAFISAVSGASMSIVRLGTTTTATATTSAAGFATMGTAARLQMAITETATRRASVAIESFKRSMASTGIGLVIVGIATALTAMAMSSSDAEQAAQELSDAILDQNGALVENHRQLIAKNLADQGVLDNARKAGIATNDLVDAYLAGGDALKPFVKQIRDYGEAQKGIPENVVDALIGPGAYPQFLSASKGMDEAANALDALGGSLEAGKQKTLEARYAAEGAAGVYANNAAETGNMSRATLAAAEAAGLAEVAINNVSVAQERSFAYTSGLAQAHTDYADAAVRSQGLIQTVFSATEAAVRAVQTAYQDLTTLFSDVRATDRAYTALLAMKEQLKSNKAGIDGYSEAAMTNRDKMLSYAESQLAVAQSIEDPIAALEVLKTTQQEVADALKGQGVKPKDSEIYQQIQASITAAEDAVGEMDTAVENAKTAGLDVSAAIAAGITAGMTEQEAAIDAAGVLGGTAAADGINSALGISSPSRVAMEAGRNTGLGLIEGLNQMKTASGGAGMNIGAEIVRGMITALNNGQGPVAAAARAVVAAAIAAAREEGKITSPSKVFMGMGHDVVSGLVIGIERSAFAVPDAAASMIRSLRDSGEMAVDGFVAGMESRRSAMTSALTSLTREAEGFSPTVTGQMTTVRAAIPTMRPQGESMMGGGSRGGIHIENLNVTSAPGERAETSIPRNLRRMAWVAGLDG